MVMTPANNGMALTGVLYLQPPTAHHNIEAWEEAIAVLDAAIADMSRARAEIDSEGDTLDRIEASTVLTIEGSNAEIRKARLTLALADDARYQAHLQLQRAARERLADAERRMVVARERCRLLRAAMVNNERAA